MNDARPDIGETPERGETPEKDAPLRYDTRLLGRILGDTVRAQEGERVFDLVEREPGYGVSLAGGIWRGPNIGDFPLVEAWASPDGKLRELDGKGLDGAVVSAIGWEKLAASVAEAERLTRPDKVDLPALATRAAPSTRANCGRVRFPGT